MENKTRGIEKKKRWKVERVNNSHMERQVDEKFIKKTLSRLRCSSKSGRVSCLHSRRSAPQRALTSAYPVSPHRLPGKKAVLFQTQLEAKRKKEIPTQVGGDYSSCRLDLTSKTTFRYIWTGKRRREKNFWFFSLYLFPFHLFKGPQETEFHHRTA